jgi:NAD(P)-dependent dehydrogenase (short-subunit alcohol dehydrogenase family)
MTRPFDKKVWFVTGAGRGMGVDIANARRATTKINI